MVILIVAAIAISVFVVRQWENVKTIYGAKVNSTETIIRNAEASKEEQRTLLEENDISVVPPSLDQIDSLIDGKSTADEVKTEIGVDAEAKQTAPVEAPRQNAGKQPQPLTKEQREAKAKERIESSVKELYAYEVELMATLGELKQQAIDEYHALPKDEQIRSNKYKIGYKYLNKCYDMEVEADGRVKSILDQLRDELTALDEDTAIVDTLWQKYCDEKANAKSYYLSKYL